MNIQKPLVSILVPVYGVEKYIEICAISVFEQTYNNLEIIFVNDCTKDRSIEVLRNLIDTSYNWLVPRIKIINHQENSGLAMARNTALDNATGDFVFHLDSDDYLNIDAIELLVEEAINTSADIVFSDTNIIYFNEVTKKANSFVDNNEDYLKSIILRKNNFNVWGNLYKKELYNEVRFFESVNFGEDYVTLPRVLFFSKKNVYLQKVTYNYLKLNTASYTSSLKEKSIDEIFIGYEKMYDFFKRQNAYIDIVEDAFYVLKSHMIKSSKGNRNILDYIKKKTFHKPNKYPKENSFINNSLNFLFDNNLIYILSTIIKNALYRGLKFKQD
nr:glycosyltransferase family 2 protein [uncultured Flavobacterium sp.]